MKPPVARVAPERAHAEQPKRQVFQPPPRSADPAFALAFRTTNRILRHGVDRKSAIRCGRRSLRRKRNSLPWTDDPVQKAYAADKLLPATFQYSIKVRTTVLLTRRQK